MNREPARRLHSLISQLEPHVAAAASRPLNRLVARPDAGDALIVAVVGPSGVGKSELLNRLAGTRVVTAGPLRPTTTAPAVWGEVDDSYLPGTRVDAAPFLDHLALVDTPAVEHAPEIVDDVLDLADVALLIVSPDRYADNIVESLLETIEDRGVPLWIGLSALVTDALDLREITADIERVLGAPVAAVSAESADSFGAFLADLTERRGRLAEERDRGAADFIADRALAVADEVEDVNNEARVVFERAVETLPNFAVDRSGLADAVDLEWDDAVGKIADLGDGAATQAIEDFRASAEEDAAATRAIDAAIATVPGARIEPIADWRRETDDRALAAVRRKWLHPMRARAVRDEMWRLAASYQIRPSTKVRKALRSQVADLRIERSEALDTAMRESVGPKIGAVLSALDPNAAVQAADVRAAAEDLRNAGRGAGAERDEADA